MSVNNQEECSFSELELFKRPPVRSDILNRKFEKIYPITKLEDSGPIEFQISRGHFLDLRQSPQSKRWLWTILVDTAPVM